MIKEITDALKKAWEEQQTRPDQYVVVIKRIKDDSIIGYHLSTMCQVTTNILNAKRYAGKNPYNQIKTIFNNIKSCIFEENEEDGIKSLFIDIFNNTKKEYYQNLTIEDIYLDAIYLNPNIEPQSFRYQVL